MCRDSDSAPCNIDGGDGDSGKRVVSILVDRVHAHTKQATAVGNYEMVCSKF